jgi:hypothetical protein
MLHYGVWIVALPLIAPWPKTTKAVDDKASNQATELSGRPNLIWDVRSVPLARHPRGFPKLVGAALVLGVVVVVMLWVSFSMDYATTRDIYFTVAIAHVVAEAPFLLKML